MRPGEEDVVESLRLELPEQGSGVEVRIYECFRDESHGVEPEADREEFGDFRIPGIKSGDAGTDYLLSFIHTRRDGLCSFFIP